MAKSRTSGGTKPRCGVRQVRGPFVRLAPHKQHCKDVPALISLLRGRNEPRAVDLFCGAGGLSLGLRDAGFDVIMGIDHDPEAIETHAAMFPGISATWDLSDPAVVERVAEVVRKARVTLVAGGPPCQPFSNAGKGLIRHLVATGKRHERDERAELWQSFLAVIEKSLPPAVLMENVPELALDPTMSILREMVERLEVIGYRVETQVLETWRYGVPQFRERLFLVAVKQELQFEWPAASSDRTTVHNAIGDLPEVEGGARPEGGAAGWWAYDKPLSRFQKRARKTVRPRHRGHIYDHITRPVRPDDLAAFSQMDSKTRYTDIPVELRRYRDDVFTDKYKRLDANDLSRTITAHISKDGYWYIHPSQHRTLTVREAARIQTFRDDVRFAGPPSSAFRQIGNAVPPLVGEHLGVALLRSLKRKAGPRSRPSTIESARLIARWFSSLDSLRVPWLRARTRWQVLLCEHLFDRVRPDLSTRAWPMIEHLDTPRRTISLQRDLVEIAGYVGRTSTSHEIIEIAKWFCDHPSYLKSTAALERVPHVDSVTAALARWVVPAGGDPPVVASSSLLRIAARVTGVPDDRRNKLTDGRIAIARLIGVGETCRDAFLGLVEMGRSICKPQDPICHECPLLSICKTGSTHVRRRPLLFHVPGDVR